MIRGGKRRHLTANCSTARCCLTPAPAMRDGVSARGIRLASTTATLTYLELPMKGIAFTRFAVLLSAVSLVAGASAWAQDHAPIHFAGLLNDYVPATSTAPLYEMHGTWTMDIDARSGTADFSIVMTMANFAS